MKKSLHILAPYPQGEAPSQRFRFEQYLSDWEQAGYTIHFHSFHTKRSWKRLYQPGKIPLKIADICWNFLRMWGILFRLIPAKNIFMHREMAHMGPPIFEWILAKVFRKKYVYDFDDAIWIPNYSAANARFQQLKCYWKIPYLIKWAHRVQGGNAYLVNYAKQFNPNCSVVPTTIDTEHLHNRLVNHDNEKVIIGWTGTHSTMHYLEPLFPILMKLEKEFNFEFHVISNKPLKTTIHSMRYIEWNANTEISDLSQFHIGLMPLEKDQWSEGKCGFKALQYMALGAVAIVSPVGVNETIVQHAKNGWIAGNTEEWENGLRQLLTDPEKRKLLGLEARKSIIDHWSVLAWKTHYLNLF